jgi:ribosomal protein S18
MLANHDMNYECRVLKKVIKSEDEFGKIERIEFNSDPKVIKKFIKRHSKCKSKKDRARKTGLREKILNTQL